MRISRRCYAVTGLAYSPPWSVNAGFAVGDAVTLVIDTGGSALAGATVHGYASAVRTSNSLAVVNTERHFDHVLGNCFFEDRGIEIWAHPAATRAEAEFQAEKAEYNDAILNAARRAAHEEDAFFSGTRLANAANSAHDGQQFDLGGCDARILFTPGHTVSNLSVWIPSDRVLFAGDCLINNYLPNLDAGAPADWRMWLDSLRRIEDLNPATVLCGHGPVAQGPDVKRIIDVVRRTLETRLSAAIS